MYIRSVKPQIKPHIIDDPLVHREGVSSKREALILPDSKKHINGITDKLTVEPRQKLLTFSCSLDESAENVIEVFEKQARLAGFSEPVLLRCFVPGKLHGDAGSKVEWS